MKISTYIVALFVVVAIVPTRKIYSQTYTPFPVANAVWNITDAHLGYFGSQTVFDWYNRVYYLEGDTLISNLSYHKLFSNIHSYMVTVSGDTLSSEFSFHDYAGSIREDSFKHVYFKIPALIDSLLYDFNLSIGDSTSTLAYIQAIVDSIDSFYVNNHWYKTYHMHEAIPDGCENIALMEGIGSSYGFYTDCFEGLSMLNCFTENGVHIYGDITIDCNQFVWTSTEIITNSNKLIISPNPFATNATVTLPNYPTQFSLQLFDQFGREMKFEYNTVHSGKNFTITIDKDEIPSGIYFLSVASGMRRAVAKLVVQ